MFYGIIMFVAGIIMFVAGNVMFLAGNVMFVAGIIMFVTGNVMFVAGIIMFRAGNVMFVAGIIMFQAGNVMFQAGNVMFQAGIIMFETGNIMFETALCRMNEPRDSSTVPTLDAELKGNEHSVVSINRSRLDFVDLDYILYRDAPISISSCVSAKDQTQSLKVPTSLDCRRVGGSAALFQD